MKKLPHSLTNIANCQAIQEVHDDQHDEEYEQDEDDLAESRSENEASIVLGKVDSCDRSIFRVPITCKSGFQNLNLFAFL